MTEPADPRHTDAWGIDRHYQDAYGEWHAIPEETRLAVMEAMEADPACQAPTIETPVLFLRPGRPACLIGAGELVLETGERLHVESALPANLPFGYHVLHPADGSGRIRVIVSPDRCFLPEDLKTWGWALQLYALRSRSSWGIGDLHDLGDFAAWSATELGAGVLMINPLHAAMPLVPQQTSPYFPSSRRYRNPLYLRIEDVPRAEQVSPDLERIACAARELNSRRLIDRDAVFRLKMRALEQIWRSAEPGEGFDTYRAREGPELERFATFCALAERYNSGWRQ
jgi:4-alpha-glucanotransferase